MIGSIQANATTFNWEQWSKLPREEREAEMKEQLKQQDPEEFDAVIREAIDADAAGNLGIAPIARFTWDIAELDNEVDSSDISHQREPRGEIKCGERRDYPLNGMPYRYCNGVFQWADSNTIDHLTGSQMSTTSAFYQDAMDVGNESVGLEATDFVSWWNVDSSDMVAAEGSQFDDTFKSLSASDLPTAPDADSMADLQQLMPKDPWSAGY